MKHEQPPLYEQLPARKRERVRRQIIARRDRGESYADIAYALRAEYDVHVTGETIRKWYLRWVSSGD
jgi:intein-encoded DNA endonuclease-like protein